MSVSLKKGQKVDLTKGNSGLKRVMVGLGWDEAQKPVGFGRLFGGRSVQDFDCDAMAFVLQKGKITQRQDVVFFNNLNHPTGCVIHRGDNLTGGGQGDDEQIMVELSRLPMEYDRIVFVVSIYQANERNQHFGMINNAFIRIVDADTNKELCIYNLSSEDYNGKCAMVFGELYRKDGEWKFNAIGQPMNIWAVDDLAERYGLPKNVWR